MSAEIIPIGLAVNTDFESEDEPVGAGGGRPTVAAGPSLAVPSFPRTDFGNAERLVARHGENMLFTATHGWLVWDGVRWARNETGVVMRNAKETVRSILRDAVSTESSTEREAMAKHAIASESASRLRAMVTLAETEKTVAITANALDEDPWLLNVLNGTVDLRTGIISPHRREDRITKVARVFYDPTAQCPLFEAFLNKVQPDSERRLYLKRLAGYASTGVIREHVLPVFYGAGRNGKGVFTNALQHVLGDYAVTVPSDLLQAKKNDDHPTARADLHGCRLAVASETEQNRGLATSLVKQLTGDDPIAARRMHKDFFRFAPTHKIVLATNHRPVIHETKDAIWDRVHLIPWDVRIPPNEQDLALGEKLKKEASGILRWIIEGCLEWQRVGLAPPTTILAATKEYRTDMDSLGDFLTECCVLEGLAHVSRRNLRNAYERWADEVGQRYRLDPRSFADALRERGCSDGKMRESPRSSPVRGWKGIRLRGPDEHVDTWTGGDTNSAKSPHEEPFEGETPKPPSTGDYVSTPPSADLAPGPNDGAGEDREIFDL